MRPPKDASSSPDTPKDETEFHFNVDVKLFPKTRFYAGALHKLSA